MLYGALGHTDNDLDEDVRLGRHTREEPMNEMDHLRIGNWLIEATNDDDDHLTLIISRPDDDDEVIEIEGPDQMEVTVRFTTVENEHRNSLS